MTAPAPTPTAPASGARPDARVRPSGRAAAAQPDANPVPGGRAGSGQGEPLRTMTTVVVPLALVVVLLAPPVTASAASGTDARAEARERFDRGLRLFDEGDSAGALAEFKRAHELVPNQLVLFNIGLVYAALARPVEATDALDRVLRDPGATARREAGARAPHARRAGGADRAARRHHQRARRDRRRRRRGRPDAARGAPAGGQRRARDRRAGAGPPAVPARDHRRGGRDQGAQLRAGRHRVSAGAPGARERAAGARRCWWTGRWSGARRCPRRWRSRPERAW